MSHTPPASPKYIDLNAFQVDLGIDDATAQHLGVAGIGKITKAELLAGLYNHALDHSLHSLQDAIMRYADQYSYEEYASFIEDLGPATQRLTKKITVADAAKVIAQNKGRIPFQWNDVFLGVGFSDESETKLYCDVYDSYHGGAGQAESVIRRLAAQKSIEVLGLIDEAVQRAQKDGTTRSRTWQDFVTADPLPKPPAQHL